MIYVKSPKKNFGINFPTAINEITVDNLNDLTRNIKLPKHYCLVALCYNTTIFEFCTSLNGNKNTSVIVNPILAKISDEDSALVNANVGEKIIVNRSSLERATHINIPTSISANNARNYFNSDLDLVRSIITKDGKATIVDKKLNKTLVASSSPEIIILEFKILAVNDISASIIKDEVNIDPFKDYGNNN